MDAHRDLAQVLEGAVEPGRDLRQAFLQLGRFGRHDPLGGADLEAERDEALLDAVVQIALDPPPRLVGRRDDTRAGGGQLGATLGVRDRGGHELREAGQARLGVGRQRPRLGGRRDDGPPEAVLDDDRRG